MKNHHKPRGIHKLLENPRIRHADAQGQRWYVVTDLISLLSDSADAEDYWQGLKQREPQLGQIAEQMEAPFDQGEAMEMTDVVNLEGVLRLIQSIPSPKAERVKRWIARSIKARLDEAENPELAAVRMRKLYERKGYSRRWVDKRLRGISSRHELTSEWARRGATESEQYRNLTNQIMENAFGMDVESYRRLKHLQRPGQNLRDSMTDLELVITMLGEVTAAVLHRDRHSNNFEQLQADARDAGQIAAQTRRQIEAQSGQPVIHPGYIAERPTSKAG